MKQLWEEEEMYRAMIKMCTVDFEAACVSVINLEVDVFRIT